MPEQPYIPKFKTGQTIETLPDADGEGGGCLAVIIGTYSDIKKFSKGYCSVDYNNSSPERTLYLTYLLDIGNMSDDSDCYRLSWAMETEIGPYCVNIEKGKEIIRRIDKCELAEIAELCDDQEDDFLKLIERNFSDAQ